VIQSSETLLVADGTAARRLSDSLGAGRCVRCADPYDALVKMSRRRWSTVVLSATRAGFAGLCRASRRLQREAKLYALCSPAMEPEVRPLAGKVLDDYFIYPPSQSEVRRMTAPPEEHPAEAAPLPASAGQAPWVIGPDELTGMVAAARTTADLEDHLARLVSASLGIQVEWLDLGTAPPAHKPLLLAAGDVPRVLVPTGQAAGRVVPVAAPQTDQDKARFLAGLQQCLPALVANAKHTEALHRLAVTDYLTGAYNRRYFYHLTDQILRRGRSRNFRVALLLFDIDDFKRYNDTYGHAVGDEILREAARLMKQTTRAQDIVARIGGDEFAVLFWDNAGPRKPDSAPPATAQVMAERFRRILTLHTFPSLGPEARGALTISGGLATFPAGGKTCRELLRSADGALRAVKASGKNAIHLVGR